MWDTIKQTAVYIMKPQKRKETEKVFEKIMVKILPPVKNINL